MSIYFTVTLLVLAMQCALVPATEGPASGVKPATPEKAATSDSAATTNSGANGNSAATTNSADGDSAAHKPRRKPPIANIPEQYRAPALKVIEIFRRNALNNPALKEAVDGNKILKRFMSRTETNLDSLENQLKTGRNLEEGKKTVGEGEAGVEAQAQGKPVLDSDGKPVLEPEGKPVQDSQDKQDHSQTEHPKSAQPAKPGVKAPAKVG